MTEFIVQTLHGLTLGALFALVAIGYTMVFGIIKLINFAHGEFYMAGGFAGMFGLLYFCSPGKRLGDAPGALKLFIAMACAGLAVACLAILVERLAYRPIRHAGRISALLTAVGVSLLLQNVAITIFGAKNTHFPDMITDQRYHLESNPSLEIRSKQIIIFISLAVSALLLYLLVQRTRVGRAMRAVSHDMEAASLMGVDSARIVTLTFGIGGMFAGIAGVLAGGMFISTVDPLMGFLFGLKAFIAAVLGGIGSIQGALLGGIVLGLVEQYAQAYADVLLFKGASAYRDAIAFIILIGVLLIRPRGFFGKIEGEKV